MPHVLNPTKEDHEAVDALARVIIETMKGKPVHLGLSALGTVIATIWAHHDFQAHEPIEVFLEGIAVAFYEQNAKQDNAN